MKYKTITAILFVFAIMHSSFSQNYLQEGSLCFDRGDYTCAISKYNAALQSSNANDKRIAELRINTAKRCAELIRTADDAFAKKNYTKAKNGYLSVLESNPKDNHAKKQIERIETASTSTTAPATAPTPVLRRATSSDIADIWNNKYGVMPVRRQNLINAGIDPDDAQRRIANGEGKPAQVSNQPPQSSNQRTSFSVSTEKVNFKTAGGRNIINVNNNKNPFKVTNLPSWLQVNKFDNWFTLICTEYRPGLSRKDWFFVESGSERIRIDVTQSDDNIRTEQTVNASSQLSISPNNLNFEAKGSTVIINVNSSSKDYSISYLPSWLVVMKKEETWFSLHCAPNKTLVKREDWFEVNADGKTIRINVRQDMSNQKAADNNIVKDSKKSNCFNCPKTKDTYGLTLGYIQNSFYDTEGVQLGLKIEPLFKYGFGVNTGLNLEAYTSELNFIIDNNYNFEIYAVNIPLHFEYRLNGSKWFNVFGYGGVGLNYVTDLTNYILPITLDFGGGFRINHVQFNVGQSLFIKDQSNNIVNKQNLSEFNRLYISVSYMF